MRRLIHLAYSCLPVLLGFVAGFAQDSRVDSLERLLRAPESYDKQIDLLGELSDYYSYRDSAKAMDYAQQIKELARKRNDSRGVGIAYYRIGGVFFELHQPDSAMKAYEEAEKLLHTDTTYLGLWTLAKVWHNHGALYQWKGDADTYLDMILNRAIPIQERINDSVGMGRNFYNIGIIFQNARDYERAAYYYQQSIQALQPYPGIPELPDAHIKLAETMMAAEHLHARQRTAIRGALAKADSILNRYPDDYSRVYYQNARGIYAEKVEHDLDKALDYYQQGYRLAHDSGIPRQASASLSRCYNIYDHQGKHRLALQTARTIYEEYHEYLTPQDRLLQLRNMANSHEKLGNVRESYRLQTEYAALNDSLHEAEMAFKIHNLEQKFKAKEKETQIMRLNQEMQAQVLQAQRNRLWTILLGAVILLVVGISAAGYNIFRKKQLIAKQRAELLEQNMKKMKQEQHISVFAAMLEGQEQERKRLAIDLHDGLGGSLSSIKMKLSKVVQAGNGAIANSELPAVVNQLDASVDELRRIARNMMPETLVKYGLAVALRDYCKGLENEETKVSFQHYGLRRDIPKAIQIMVYRIIQELISNALKHARATTVLAQCLQNEHHLSITVEDDGIGFDPQRDGGYEGMGLSNVKNRVAYLGGKLDIHSEEGVGTTVNVELTYHDEQRTD